MRQRARANRSGLFLLALGVMAAVAPAVEAAQLSVDAPESCLDPSTLADEVSDLVGKPLGSVADVDFRIQISETPARRWRLQLEMVDQRPGSNGTPTVRGSRQLEGATCAELAEAAISVSVRAISPKTPAAAAPPGAANATQPVPATRSPTTLSIARDVPPTPPWHPAVVLALTSDIGALPKTGLGVDLEAELQRGALQLVAFGTWFGSQDTVTATSAGGSFQLALGGALVCFAPHRGRWTGLACGGFELGRLAGTGFGVARPETGAAFWRAARADVGVTAGLGGNAALVLRVGAAIPLSRPEFVLDGADLVYRPSRLAGRFTAGLEIGF